MLGLAENLDAPWSHGNRECWAKAPCLPRPAFWRGAAWLRTHYQHVQNALREPDAFHHRLHHKETFGFENVCVPIALVYDQSTAKEHSRQ
tara:strand:+ start:488 stop:757 length:270 start_codon:yes stop_codon:yes gene_type:complete